MSAITDDMKHISESESIIYAIIAVILTSIVLVLAMDSFLIPVFFMLSIGLAIVWNLGTNFIMGEISFLTQALALVLQLGVTMDYSIFLFVLYILYLNFLYIHTPCLEHFLIPFSVGNTP